MNIGSKIWTPLSDDEDGQYRDGEIILEVAEDDLIILRLYVDGEQVAHAELDRFRAGVLVGRLDHASVEALPS